MLDQRCAAGLDLRKIWRTLANATQPFFRRLDRSVRRVIRKEKKERRVLLLPSAEEFDRPFGEEVGRVARRFDLLHIVPHVIDAMTQMRVVIVHHVAKKAAKQIEAALRRDVRRRKTQVPFAHQGGRKAGRSEHGREQNGVARSSPQLSCG